MPRRDLEAQVSTAIEIVIFREIILLACGKSELLLRYCKFKSLSRGEHTIQSPLRRSHSLSAKYMKEEVKQAQKAASQKLGPRGPQDF